jgi:hypothetical protein
MAEADAGTKTRALRVFVAASWLIAVAAGMFRLWSAALAVSLDVLWLLLFVFSLRRFGKRSLLWLLLPLPFIVIAPLLLLPVIIGLCFLGVWSHGCF